MSIQGNRTLLRKYKGNTVEKHSSKKKYRFLEDTYVRVFFFGLLLVETTVFHCRIHHSVISVVAVLIEAHPALYETTYLGVAKVVRKQRKHSDNATSLLISSTQRKHRAKYSNVA